MGVYTFVCVVLLVCISRAKAQKNSNSGAPEKPNVLFIMADDMGQWAAHTYGNPDIYTPNIDKLADEGVKFTNAFCNTPVCSASRSTYFTGRLPSQSGVHDWINGGNGCKDDGIFYTRNEVTYTDILANNGYTCAMIGKYHLGDQQVMQHSFKHWFVHQKGGGDYNNPPMVENLQCVNVEGYITDIITDNTLSFLDDYHESNSSQPFYISVHYTAPHGPYVGSDGKADSMHPKEIVDRYSNSPFVNCPREPASPYQTHFEESKGCLNNTECFKGYYAAVTAMDLNIGRLLTALKLYDLEQGTLVVFTSDHGFNTGHHGLWGKGNAAYPLNMFETSLRIPMVWRHTGVIQPGVEDSVVQVLDVAPTLLSYTSSAPFSHDRNAPGESFVDLLLDQSKRNSRKQRTIYGEYGQVRFARYNSSVKYITRLTGHIELYDLTNDGNEKKNLLSPLMESNSNNEALAGKLDRMLRLWFSYYEAPDVSGWTQAVTGTGQQRAIYYNESGWPTNPAFNHLTIV